MNPPEALIKQRFRSADERHAAAKHVPLITTLTRGCVRLRAHKLRRDSTG